MHEIIHDYQKDERVSFIYQNLLNIENELNNFGSSIWLIHDTPLNAFKLICSTFNVGEVYSNHDYEPYAMKRDKEVADFLSTMNISFHTSKDQVVFEKDEVLKNDGTPYTIFTPYSKIWKQKLKETEVNLYGSENLLSNLIKTNAFRFPLLNEIGFESSSSHTHSPVIDKQIISNYDRTRNFPSINETSLRILTVPKRKCTLSRLVPLIEGKFLVLS